MKNIFILLFLSIFLSLNKAYSQTIVNSSHPKSDSLYSQNENISNQKSVPIIFDSSKAGQDFSAQKPNKTFFTGHYKTYIEPFSKPKIYRDTRLGSSSPLYNTYKKNDYGAGAITNNPNK